jgi:hypothetical protein
MPLTSCYATNIKLCHWHHFMPLTSCYATNNATEIYKTLEHVTLRYNEFCKKKFEISQITKNNLTHAHLDLDFVYWCLMMSKTWPKHVTWVIKYHVIILLCLAEICNVRSVKLTHWYVMIGKLFICSTWCSGRLLCYYGYISVVLSASF